MHSLSPCHVVVQQLLKQKEAGSSTKCSEMIFDMYSINVSCIIITCHMRVEISHDFIHIAIAKFERDQLPVPDTVDICNK